MLKIPVRAIGQIDEGIVCVSDYLLNTVTNVSALADGTITKCIPVHIPAHREQPFRLNVNTYSVST